MSKREPKSPLPTVLEPDPSHRWGHEYGAARPMFHREEEGLRVAVFGSAWRGLNVVTHLLREELNHSGLLHIVGLATDEVDESKERKAKISAGKRLWQYMSPEDQTSLQGFVLHSALFNGIPAYTGSVKSEAFWAPDGLLQEWDPDVIVMATFGQLIPPEVFNIPRFGMYNFHPSDLAQGKYPGPDPFTEMMRDGETTTRMTCHHVNEGFDQGHVVGFSSGIPIQDGEGNYPDWKSANGMSPVEALHYHTGPMAGRMAVELIRAIATQRQRIDHLNFEALDIKPIGPVGTPPKSRFHAIGIEIMGGVLGQVPNLSFGV